MLEVRGIYLVLEKEIQGYVYTKLYLLESIVGNVSCYEPATIS